MSLEEREELASLYVLGLLEGSELAAFEQELASDAALASLVKELADAANHIALSAPPVTAPPAVRRRIFQEIETLRQTEQPAPVVTRSFGWVPWALAAGLAIFAGFTWTEKSRIATGNFQLSAQNNDLLTRLATLETERVQLEQNLAKVETRRTEQDVRLTSLEAEKSALTAKLAALEAERTQLAVRIAAFEARNPLDEIKAIALAPQPNAPRGASVLALWDSRHQAGVLDLSKLPAAGADKDYQLWIISPDSSAPISAGVFATAGGQAPFQAPRPLSQVAALAISLEPKGGSESARGPVIFVGKF